MKEIDFTKAKFMLSVAALTQLPEDEGIEVAFVGRSNVGKSSALNVLTQQKNLARTSKTPGRTQLINFFSLNDHLRLVDLPGYGYAKVSREIKERWYKILDNYLDQRQCLQGIILLIDIRHPLKEFDWMMLDWVKRHKIPVHILLTKADKFSRGQGLNILHQVRAKLIEIPDLTIQLFSSLKKIGLSQLREQLITWFGVND